MHAEPSEAYFQTSAAGAFSALADLVSSLRCPRCGCLPREQRCRRGLRKACHAALPGWPPLGVYLFFLFAADVFGAVLGGLLALSPEFGRSHPIVSLHLGFTALGAVFYFLVASVFIFYPHVYRERLECWDELCNRPHRHERVGLKAGQRSFTIGVAITYVTGVLPRFVLGMHTAVEYGWPGGPTQALTFLLNAVCWATATGALWSAYAGAMAERVQQRLLQHKGPEELDGYLRLYEEHGFETVRVYDSEHSWSKSYVPGIGGAPWSAPPRAEPLPIAQQAQSPTAAPQPRHGGLRQRGQRQPPDESFGRALSQRYATAADPDAARARR
eukprot:TRINITY_DN50909_c0_g1_i1.p2 TRINITY_DN50909_c0_g1~~TRINITY_DN50909_c0_g1_i1.p2  ORF type:complete len:329 (+),score=94.27 TRINITY_DN50909_c0_g1_i1:128-1114(+)